MSQGELARAKKRACVRAYLSYRVGKSNPAPVPNGKVRGHPTQSSSRASHWLSPGQTKTTTQRHVGGAHAVWGFSLPTGVKVPLRRMPFVLVEKIKYAGRASATQHRGASRLGTVLWPWRHFSLCLRRSLAVTASKHARINVTLQSALSLCLSFVCFSYYYEKRYFFLYLRVKN